MAASASQPARRSANGPITAELLCIGSELTSGHVLNTNVCYLSQQLAALGIHTVFHTSVGDEAGPMAEALGIACRRADVVIVTGGLGPTADDFTREIIAQVAGKKLLRHEPSVEALQERFRRFGTTPTENNLQQAFLPEGAEVVPNPRGTAPGFALRMERAVVIALPGVPAEMKAMFEEWVAAYLRGLGYASGVRVTRQLHCFGAGESAIDARIRHLMALDRNPVVALLAQEDRKSTRLNSSHLA